MTSWMNVRGCQFFIVYLFSFLSSWIGHKDPSIFKLKKKGDDMGRFRGQMQLMLKLSFKNSLSALCSATIKG